MLSYVFLCPTLRVWRWISRGGRDRRSRGWYREGETHLLLFLQHSISRKPIHHLSYWLSQFQKVLEDKDVHLHTQPIKHSRQFRPFIQSQRYTGRLTSLATLIQCNLLSAGTSLIDNPSWYSGCISTWYPETKSNNHSRPGNDRSFMLFSLEDLKFGSWLRLVTETVCYLL